MLYYFKYDKEDLNSLGDLNIKYNNHNAKIKNYSLLEDTINKIQKTLDECNENNTTINIEESIKEALRKRQEIVENGKGIR
ncbi:hypothetical protein A0X37_000020 (plasmid) [Campylobacter coli]|nr:hypothetical protein A0X37_000020 [Campylobacter coli]